MFRATYCRILGQKAPVAYQSIRKALWAKNWAVFAKKPFGNSNSVVEYLGRYTHKIAISNHRITAVNDQNTTFSYKDYKQGGIKKCMTLSNEEFIRRFALHILPKRFVKIRHYGFLSSIPRKTGRALEAGEAEESATQTLSGIARKTRERAAIQKMQVLQNWILAYHSCV